MTSLKKSSINIRSLTCFSRNGFLIAYCYVSIFTIQATLASFKWVFLDYCVLKKLPSVFSNAFNQVNIFLVPAPNYFPEDQ